MISSPMDFIQHWSSKSPLLTVLAVVFLIQPVISTGIDPMGAEGKILIISAAPVVLISGIIGIIKVAIASQD